MEPGEPWRRAERGAQRVGPVPSCACRRRTQEDTASDCRAGRGAAFIGQNATLGARNRPSSGNPQASRTASPRFAAPQAAPCDCSQRAPPDAIKREDDGHRGFVSHPASEAGAHPHHRRPSGPPGPAPHRHLRRCGAFSFGPASRSLVGNGNGGMGNGGLVSRPRGWTRPRGRLRGVRKGARLDLEDEPHRVSDLEGGATPFYPESSPRTRGSTRCRSRPRGRSDLEDDSPASFYDVEVGPDTVTPHPVPLPLGEGTSPATSRSGRGSVSGRSDPVGRPVRPRGRSRPRGRLRPRDLEDGVPIPTPRGRSPRRRGTSRRPPCPRWPPAGRA